MSSSPFPWAIHEVSREFSPLSSPGEILLCLHLEKNPLSLLFVRTPTRPLFAKVGAQNCRISTRKFQDLFLECVPKNLLLFILSKSSSGRWTEYRKPWKRRRRVVRTLLFSARNIPQNKQSAPLHPSSTFPIPWKGKRVAGWEEKVAHQWAKQEGDAAAKESWQKATSQSMRATASPCGGQPRQKERRKTLFLSADFFLLACEWWRRQIVGMLVLCFGGPFFLLFLGGVLARESYSRKAVPL